MPTSKQCIIQISKLKQTDIIASQTQGDLTPRPKRRQQAASSADLESFATVGSQSLTESGSDSGDDYKTSHRQSDLDSDATPRAKTMVKKSSFSRLAPIKYRTGTEPSARNVTVETETVTSIPQATIGTSSTDRNPSTHTDENGVRVKASNDTMRPKKDRKRTMRKPPSVASGTGTCEEANIASECRF